MSQAALLKPAHPDTPSELLAKLDLLRSNPTFDLADMDSVDIRQLIESLVHADLVFCFDCGSECWALMKESPKALRAAKAGKAFIARCISLRVASDDQARLIGATINLIRRRLLKGHVIARVEPDQLIRIGAHGLLSTLRGRGHRRQLSYRGGFINRGEYDVSELALSN